MNEKYKYKSVTTYIDQETGQIIDKSEMGRLWEKTKLIDQSSRMNHETYTITIIRTMGCKKSQAYQQNLF